MPTIAAPVGPLSLPAPTGAPDAQLVDPAVSAILSYCTFWLKWALDAKAATMTAPPVPDSVPVANSYTTQPSSLYLNRKLPGLFVWWDGKSKCEQRTIISWMRIRDLKVLYVYERVKTQEQLNIYSGLISTADATMHRAFDRCAHTGYAYGAYSAGTDIRTMFNLRGVEYMGGQEGFLKELPQKSARDLSTAAGTRSTEKAQGGIQAGYPSLSGVIRIYEDIAQDQLVDPDDVLRDGSLTTTVEGVPILTRYLPQSDGTEPGTGFPQD